jgi:predicted Zn finger-like uncharacterized protein
MDVRCERCKARYAIPDEQVTLEGLVLRCTSCSHVFKVRKKELVVTVPVSGEEAARAIPAPGPNLAAVNAPASPSLALRHEDGAIRPVADIATLQRWIAERQAVRDDELSRDGGPFMRLGLIQELAPFLALVEAADRAILPGARPGPTASQPPAGAGAHSAMAVEAGPPRAAPPRARPPQGGPSQSGTPQVGSLQAVSRQGASPQGGPARAGTPQVGLPLSARQGARPTPSGLTRLSAAGISPVQDAEPLDDDDLAAMGRSRSRSGWVAAGLLVVALGAAAYVLYPRLAGEPPAPLAPEPAPVRAAPAEAESPPAQPLHVQAAPAQVAPAQVAPAAEATRAEPAAPEPARAEPPKAEPASAAPAKAEPATALPARAEPPAAAKPAGTKARLAQARALRERGEPAKALAAYTRLLQDEPDNVEALNGRGLCYFELSQYGSAEAIFKQALTIAPDDPDATMGLAETYRQQGKRPEAQALYQRYLAAHPDGEEAAVARNALSELKE